MAFHFQTYPRDGGLAIRLGDKEMWLRNDAKEEIDESKFAYILEELTNFYTGSKTKYYELLAQFNKDENGKEDKQASNNE